MKFPPALVWILIPTLIAALTPVIATFWPTNTVAWSALTVAGLGAIGAAIAAYRSQTQAAQPPAQPPADTGTPGIAAQAAPMQDAPEPQRGFVRTWLIG